MAIFVTVLPRAVFRTQPKVWWSFFAKIVNKVLAVNFIKNTLKIQLYSKNTSVLCKEKRKKLSYMILHSFP